MWGGGGDGLMDGEAVIFCHLLSNGPLIGITNAQFIELSKNLLWSAK